jgi:Right handed beta helix region
MRELRIWLVSFCVFAGAIAASAENAPLNCSKESLADAVRDAGDTNQTISFTGVCVGPIVVATDGLTLIGVGTAVIDGAGNDAVTVAGASRVSLIDFEVTNGLTGIVARDGAQVSLSGVNSHDNSESGVLLQTAAIADFSDVSANHNGRTGLVADNGVGITLVDSTITGNGLRDIQLTFATRADLRTLTFGTYTCDATVLIRGTSGIVCPH